MPHPHEPVRAGLLGYGFAGRTFHAPLLSATTGLELTKIVSSNAEKVHADLPAAVVLRDAEQLFADPDIDLVVVATPNDTHAPLARAAIEAGKHVVVDKPFALDLDEARGLIETADRSGKILTVFHNRRWDSDFLSVRSAIENGTIGRVVHFESKIDRFRPQVRDRWRERNVPGGGIWFDLGPHLVDQALQLFGLPDHVSASIARQRDGSVIDDWAHVILTYGEQRVILNAGMLVAGGSARFVVHGTGGSIVKQTADRQEAQLLAGLRPGEPGWGEDPDPLTVFGDGETRQVPARSGDQRKIYEAVAAAIRGQAPNPVRPVEALAVMAVLVAAKRSAREGISVALPLTQAERGEWA